MRYPVGSSGSKQEFLDNWYVPDGGGFGYNRGSYFHEGLDINLKTGGDSDLGQELKAIANGRLVYYHYASHPSSNFGRHLVYKIDGPWGSRWVHYAHCLDTGFLTGAQDVTEGQIIARIGKSGTTLAHLHMAIFKVDPISFGIDNIANTQAELNQYWENPISFMDTWMAPVVVPQPQPITEQSQYDFGAPWGVMQMHAVRSTMNDQKRDLDNLRNENNNLKAKIGSVKQDLQNIVNSL